MADLIKRQLPFNNFDGFTLFGTFFHLLPTNQIDAFPGEDEISSAHLLHKLLVHELYA